MTTLVLLRPLTPAQVRVAQLVGEGMSYREIGHALLLSPRTVEAYVYAVADLVDVTNVSHHLTPYRRVQRWALQQDWEKSH